MNRTRVSANASRLRPVGSRRVCLSAVCCALLAGSGIPVLGQSIKHEVRYPTRFEPKVGPYGVVMVPTEFSTRETGTLMEAVVAGVATAVQANGKPAVRLRLADGRSLVTTAGRWIKIDGEVYRTMGWKKDGFHLLSRKGGKRIRFTLPGQDAE